MKNDGHIPPLLARTGFRLARRDRGRASGGAVAWLEVELLIPCDRAMRLEKLEIPLYLPDGEAIARIAIAAAIVASALVLCMP